MAICFKDGKSYAGEVHTKKGEPGKHLAEKAGGT
jgi:hypothetical protein